MNLGAIKLSISIVFTTLITLVILSIAYCQTTLPSNYFVDSVTLEKEFTPTMKIARQKVVCLIGDLSIEGIYDCYGSIISSNGKETVIETAKHCVFQKYYTNSNVIDKLKFLVIKFSDGSVVSMKKFNNIIHYTPGNDTATLTIKTSIKYPYFTTAKPSALLAAFYPMDFETGIVNSQFEVGTFVDYSKEIVFTNPTEDAWGHSFYVVGVPGMSGGPVVNLQGNLVGIFSAEEDTPYPPHAFFSDLTTP